MLSFFRRRRTAAAPRAPRPVPAGPEAMLAADHASLAPVPDERIVAAYEALREAAVPAGDTRVHPNVGRLAGTAFEREKDRREVDGLLRAGERPEMETWYAEAAEQPCTWWVKNHLVAKHAVQSCMYCGICTSQCPAAAHFEDYNPRVVVETVMAEDEERLVALLRSDALWLCGQCGSCIPQCPRENDIMGLVSSLRVLAQLKGWHLESARGRQQYAARHLWGGNFWNRGCSLYFRNADARMHPDFGPRWAAWCADVDGQMARLGASPDAEGLFGGRKLAPETLEELRRCLEQGGTLALWRALEEHAFRDAGQHGVDIDTYHDIVRSEG